MVYQPTVSRLREAWFSTATDEGVRLFFPLCALHAGLWPVVWVFAWKLGMPYADGAHSGQWHAHEMMIGSYGAALLGFLTSALPEWTDTARVRGRALMALGLAWGLGRVAGMTGAPSLAVISGIGDQAWLVFLVAYAGTISWRRKTTALLGFLAFLVALAVSAGVCRIGLVLQNYDLTEYGVWMVSLSFLGLLGLALARITVPVTNLILDPTEATSPFRPHPGRMNLAPGLVGLLLAGDVLGISETVLGFLMLAAGAAFMDRVAEGFLGRDSFRTEVAVLTLSSGLAGAGLFLSGLCWIGVPLSLRAGQHLMLMGGLGMSVLAVLSIAGLLHTGQKLAFSSLAKLAFLLLTVALLLRISLEFVPATVWVAGGYGIVAVLWAACHLFWLLSYLPLLWSPGSLDQKSC